MTEFMCSHVPCVLCVIMYASLLQNHLCHWRQIKLLIENNNSIKVMFFVKRNQRCLVVGNEKPTAEFCVNVRLFVLRLRSNVTLLLPLLLTDNNHISPNH